MCELATLDINRAIMHTIIEKETRQLHASVKESHEAVTLSEGAKNVIYKRLTNALGLNSRAFSLEIEKYDTESIFSYCKGIIPKDDVSFVNASKKIADKLAVSQKRGFIPGGYLIFLECTHTVKNIPCFIVIKAEPHEAIRQSNNGEKVLLEVLDDLILSPSQKFFKIGVIFKRDFPITEDEFTNKVYPPNDYYGCILFDENFKKATKPAEYFYKDFLGFSISKNSLIQTKKFYQFTDGFIKDSSISQSEKEDALKSLRSYIRSYNDSIINFYHFAEDFLPYEIKSSYKAEAQDYIPSSFMKDATLLKKELETKKINFPNKVMLSLPEELYGDRVKVISSHEIKVEEISDANYTWVRIAGKPYESRRNS
ncbi:nucleoid-associated protein [Larkinella sp. GY13]|uniref:nucleoid-associated protein n=1 Tax=Larkinella sp. GY13 TaxID=3453720 RepID=UPI003EEB5376